MERMKTICRRLGITIAAATGVVAASGLASAQAPAAYPTKPITLVIPSAAGGGLDIAMRHTARRMGEILGVPIVTENRPSVNLLVGTRYVAAAAPDGYTLLAMSNTFVGAMVFADNPGYDPFRDFVAISPTAVGANLLLVNASSGYASARDLVEHARKAGPGKLSFGSAGIGSSPHVAALVFANGTRTEYIDVPYKGTAPAMQDLLGGRITFLFDSVGAAQPHIKSGALRPLAVTTARRSALMPAVPTVAEAVDLPDYDLPLFYGIAAPAKTPPEVVKVLHATLTRVAADPGLREQFANLGFETDSVRSPEDYTRFLRQQLEKLKSLKR